MLPCTLTHLSMYAYYYIGFNELNQDNGEVWVNVRGVCTWPAHDTKIDGKGLEPRLRRKSFFRPHGDCGWLNKSPGFVSVGGHPQPLPGTLATQGYTACDRHHHLDQVLHPLYGSLVQGEGQVSAQHCGAPQHCAPPPSESILPAGMAGI